MKPESIFLVIASLLVLTSTAYSASFDCSKATTSVEKLICSNSGLSTLDETLGALYKQVLGKTPVPEDLKERQRNWMKGSRNTCADAQCLEKSYRQRLSELEIELKNLPFTPSLDKPLLSVPAQPPTKPLFPVVKKGPLEMIGRISFGHDAAGGRYDIVSGKKYFTIRRVWDLSETEEKALIKMEESNQYVLLKGNLIAFQDGSEMIDDQSSVQIFGQMP